MSMATEAKMANKTAALWDTLHGHQSPWTGLNTIGFPQTAASRLNTVQCFRCPVGKNAYLYMWWVRDVLVQ